MTSHKKCGFTNVVWTGDTYQCEVCKKDLGYDFLRQAIHTAGIRSLTKLNPVLMRKYNETLVLLAPKHL